MTKTVSLVKKSPAPIAGLGFSDHPAFHHTVLRAAAGGGLGALLIDLLVRLVPGVDTIPFPALVLGIASGSLAMVAGHGKKGWLKAILGGALGVAAGAMHYASSAFPWFAALLVGAISAPVLAKGESGGRMAVTGLVTGLFTFAGLYVAQVLQHKGILLDSMPGPIATAVAGSAAGLFVGLGSVPRHLIAAEDPVESAYLAALSVRDGETHEILTRAFSIYQAIDADFENRKAGSTEQELGQRVGDLSMRILQIAEQCRRIERDLGTAPASVLEERISALQKKADAAKDEGARGTFLSAIQSLESQRGAVEAISRGLERVLAKLHANVALLEKVRFSLVHARSANAERIGGESSPLAETIEELSRELDLTSAAVGEVFGAQGRASSFISAPAELTAPRAVEETKALTTEPRDDEALTKL